MPAEHDAARVRQLEALRRHMAHPDTRWEPPTEVGLLREHSAFDLAGPERRRPPRSWLLLTGLLVTLALVGGVVVGAVAWSDDRPAPVTNGVAGTASGGRAPGTTTVAPVATPACKTAVDRANAMLASAVRLREALAEHARILRDPGNRGRSGDEVLERLAPSQRTGSSESARFDRALDEYRQVVDQCGLRLP
jgi:hypothetical protein